jgi:hypothetical protein
VGEDKLGVRVHAGFGSELIGVLGGFEHL